MLSPLGWFLAELYGVPLGALSARVFRHFSINCCEVHGPLRDGLWRQFAACRILTEMSLWLVVHRIHAAPSDHLLAAVSLHEGDWTAGELGLLIPKNALCSLMGGTTAARQALNPLREPMPTGQADGYSVELGLATSSFTLPAIDWVLREFLPAIVREARDLQAAERMSRGLLGS